MGRLHAMGLGHAAIATHDLGDAPLAISQLREAFVRQSSIHLGLYCAATLCHIDAAHAKTGEIEEAVRTYQRGIEQYGESNPRDIANAWRELSEIQELTGDVVSALRSLRQALAAEKRFNDHTAVLAAAKAEQRIEITRLAANWTRIAEEDPLTGLPNRRAFRQRIAHALATLSATEHLALVIVDVDHFKRINDEHGHEVGDVVLPTLGKTLARAIRKRDFAARLGGEEFVLMFRCSGAAHAQLLAERAINEIRIFDWSGHCAVKAVTASAGISLQSEIKATESDTIKALYVLADDRLYQARRLGRDRVVAGDRSSVAEN